MSEIRAEKMAAELSRRGTVWADCDAAYFALDETKKDVLSACMARVNDQELSMVKIEQQARLMPEWKEHQAMLAEARLKMNTARVSFDAYKAYIELARSENATEREAMRLR
jgi:Mg2+/Co2+ transporter CorC